MRYFLLTFCLAALGEASLRYHADQTYASSYSHPKYHFGYSVDDTHPGDHNSQWEEREGDRITGGYAVHDPDGKLRQVDYVADDQHGFTVHVTKDAHPFSSPIVVPSDFVAPSSHNSGLNFASNHQNGVGYDFIVDHGGPNEHIGPIAPDVPTILTTENELISGYDTGVAGPNAIGYGPQYGYDININHAPYSFPAKPKLQQKPLYNRGYNKLTNFRRDYKKRVFRVPASARKVIIHTGRSTKSLTITPALSSKKIIIKHRGKVYKYKKGRLVQININKNKKRKRKPRKGTHKIFFPLD